MHLRDKMVSGWSFAYFPRVEGGSNRGEGSTPVSSLSLSARTLVANGLRLVVPLDMRDQVVSGWRPPLPFATTE